MLRVNLMIGDRDVSATDGRTFERIDPLTGLVATESAAATIADAVAAAEAAARAFAAWSALGPSERRAMLMAAAEVVQSRAEDFAEAMMAEHFERQHEYLRQRSPARIEEHIQWR